MVVKTTTAILEPQFERPVSGADLVAFQRLVRRVPVADPVMRYALSIVRASRPNNPTCPEAIKKWIAFGASVRAAQYLVLGGKARALTERPLPRELRRHPRGGAFGDASPRADQLPRAVGRRHQRFVDRQAAGVGPRAAVGDVIHPGTRHKAPPGTRHEARGTEWP